MGRKTRKKSEFLTYRRRPGDGIRLKVKEKKKTNTCQGELKKGEGGRRRFLLVSIHELGRLSGAAAMASAPHRMPWKEGGGGQRGRNVVPAPVKRVDQAPKNPWAAFRNVSGGTGGGRGVRG